MKNTFISIIVLTKCMAYRNIYWRVERKTQTTTLLPLDANIITHCQDIIDNDTQFGFYNNNM